MQVMLLGVGRAHALFVLLGLFRAVQEQQHAHRVYLGHMVLPKVLLCAPCVLLEPFRAVQEQAHAHRAHLGHMVLPKVLLIAQCVRQGLSVALLGCLHAHSVSLDHTWLCQDRAHACHAPPGHMLLEWA